MDLQAFQSLIEKTRALFLEENALLKRSAMSDHAVLLERKKTLLAELDEGVMQLKALRESKADADKALLRTLQDSIMQLLMLDRENEQLLLKQSVGSFQAKQPVKTTVAALERMYKKV